MIFYEDPKKVDFSSKGFKLLWEKEKGINVDELKIWMQSKPEQEVRVVSAAPDAAAYFK